jgi:protease-4
MSRRLAAWRALAILAVVAAIGAALFYYGEVGPKHVARLPVAGAITSDRSLMELVEELGERDDVAAVLVSINSPGGTSVGGERLYKALRELDAKKPVVAQIDTLGASAAYMAALASDHIVAYQTSLTGSVGVLIQYGQINEFLAELGIEVDKVDSGPLKAEPSPFQPVEPEAVAALQSVVDDTFDWFLNLVRERRELAEGDLDTIATGRIFTGEQALQQGLVDEIGGEEEAIAWLERERGVTEDLPVRTYRPDDDGSFSTTAWLAETVIRQVFTTVGVNLPVLPTDGSVDGLWSLWHASSQSGQEGSGR